MSSNRYRERPWGERDGDAVEQPPVARAGDRERTKGEGLGLVQTSTKLKTWGTRGIVFPGGQVRVGGSTLFIIHTAEGVVSTQNLGCLVFTWVMRLVWSVGAVCEVAEPGRLVAAGRPCSGAICYAVSYGVALHRSRRHALESSTPPDLARTTRCIMRLLQQTRGDAGVESGRRAGGLHTGPS